MSLKECAILKNNCSLVHETPFLLNSHLSISYTYIELLCVIKLVLESQTIQRLENIGTISETANVWAKVFPWWIYDKAHQVFFLNNQWEKRFHTENNATDRSDYVPEIMLIAGGNWRVRCQNISLLVFTHVISCHVFRPRQKRQFPED